MRAYVHHRPLNTTTARAVVYEKRLELYTNKRKGCCTQSISCLINESNEKPQRDRSERGLDVNCVLIGQELWSRPYLSESRLYFLELRTNVGLDLSRQHYKRSSRMKPTYWAAVAGSKAKELPSHRWLLLCQSCLNVLFATYAVQCTASWRNTSNFL